MLENATVAMPYSELQELLEKLKLTEEAIRKLNDPKLAVSNDIAQKNPIVQALDRIFDLLDDASKETESCHKQARIYECMCIYCDTFDIPRKELMDGIPNGSEEKEE